MHITYISEAIEISRQTAKINRPKLGKCSQTHNTTIFGVSIFPFLWISVCIYFNIKHTLTTIMHVTSTSETLKISRQTCNKNWTTLTLLLLLTPFRSLDTLVRTSVAAAGEPGSMAAEPAGPVSVPATTSQEGKPPSEGGPRTPGPAAGDLTQ